MTAPSWPYHRKPFLLHDLPSHGPLLQEATTLFALCVELTLASPRTAACKKNHQVAAFAVFDLMLSHAELPAGHNPMLLPLPLFNLFSLAHGCVQDTADLSLPSPLHNLCPLMHGCFQDTTTLSLPLTVFRLSHVLFLTGHDHHVAAVWQHQ